MLQLPSADTLKVTGYGAPARRGGRQTFLFVQTAAAESVPPGPKKKMLLAMFSALYVYSSAGPPAPGAGGQGYINNFVFLHHEDAARRAALQAAGYRV